MAGMALVFYEAGALGMSNKASTAMRERVFRRAGWCEEVNASKQSDGARVGGKGRMQDEGCAQNSSACVRYKKTLRWRVFVINSR